MLDWDLLNSWCYTYGQNWHSLGWGGSSWVGFVIICGLSTIVELIFTQETNALQCFVATAHWFTRTAHIFFVVLYRNITSVQSNLAKGRIANLSPSQLRTDSSDLDLHLIHGSLDQHESAPKRHLHLFSRFCTAHRCNQNAQTHRPRYMRHLYSIAMK